MASLKDLIVTGPARFLDKLYGNLEGNAATATKLETARTLTLGNSSFSFDGSLDKAFTLTVSNAWETGTSAGPKIKTTVNGVTGAAVEIPVATASASGIVTNTAQTFAGNKMFNGDILLHMGDSDRSIVFSYSNSTTISPSASWRIAGLGTGTGDTNYFVVQSGTSGTAGIETWNNVVRIGQNTFDIALGGNVYPLTNDSKSLGTSSLQWKDAWFSGTVTLSKTTDAAGTANNQPALIVGGTATTAHLELDSNELMAKTNGTSVAELYLNSNGGLVHVGSGGLQIDEGNILSYSSSTTDRQIRVQNSNGSVGIYTSTNRGLYDITKGGWIIYRTKDAVTTYIPEWASIGAAADRPIYMSSSGRPAITTYRMAATNATATSAHSITTDLPTGIWYVSGTSDILGQSDGVAIVNQYNSSWITEIYQDYRTGQIAVRGKNNGTWQAWRKILDSSNYTNYTVTKTGVGASGSNWGISITGSSASCTGNAATATKATKDGSGNTITSTYLKLAGGTMTGLLSANGGIALNNSTPNESLTYILGIRAFADGGNIIWQSASSVNVGYASSAGAVAWGNVTGKPSTFTPSSHTHNYLTAGSEGATASVRTADHTAALVTGGWATTSAGYKHQYGTTLDISGYSTWYHRLAFNTTGHIEYWHGINTKTLTKIGYLYTTQNIVYSSQQPTSNLVHGMIWLYPA